MLSKSKVALVQVARKQLGLSDDDYRAELLNHGGVTGSKHLDERGFDAVMARFAQLGFVSQRTAAAGQPRLNRATPAQVQLIRDLWAEMTVTGTEQGLCRWLDRHWGISSVQFLTPRGAGRVIGALRKWQERKATDAA